ncbi:MAG: tetratricopeptide repeat protein [Myxococcales bacterium]|nr:tetratricopeptide repeat protein [Myxococcales bacterium]
MLADAALLQGRLLAELSRFDEAEAALQQAYFAADQVGCSGLAVDAANRLAKSLALNPAKEVTSWWFIALTKLEQMHNPDTSPIRAPQEESLYNLRKAEVYNNRGLLRQRKLKDPECEQSGAPNCGKDLKGAEADFLEALRLRELAQPRPLADLSATERNLGAVMMTANRIDEGVARLEQGLKLAQEAFGSDHPATWVAHFDLGKALGASERDNSDPQTHLEAALRLASLALAPGSFKLGEIQLELAMHYESVGVLDLAVAHAKQAEDIFRALNLPISHSRRLNALRMLGYAYHELKQYDDALPIREQILAGTARDNLQDLLISHLELATTLNALHRWPEALRRADAACLLADILGIAADAPMRADSTHAREVALAGLGTPAGAAQ